MSQRIDLIKQENARVALIDLAVGEESPWHSHTELIENVICLRGTIEVQFQNPDFSIHLKSGERFEIKASQQHRLVNLSEDVVPYLLVQNGKYDFVLNDL